MVWNLNVQGTPGLWRLYELVKAKGSSKPDALMMQEIRPPEGERITIEFAWQQLGYYTYIQEGEVSRGRWDSERSLGGVMTCVSKHWRQQLVSKTKHGVVQQITVRMADWNLVNLYGPPRNREDFEKLVVDMIVSANRKTLAGADWNETCDDFAAKLIVQLPMRPVSFHESASDATRWEGSERIDWFATNTNDDTRSTKTRTEKYLITRSSMYASKSRRNKQRSATRWIKAPRGNVPTT